jgi:hypothetical protein
VNAYVLYETDPEFTDINRVYVGEGNIHKLRIEFKEEVEASLGPQPPEPKMIDVVHDGNTYNVQDAAQKKASSDWLTKRWELIKSRKFGRWLVEKKGWVEAEEVYSDQE